MCRRVDRTGNDCSVPWTVVAAHSLESWRSPRFTTFQRGVTSFRASLSR